MIASEVELLDWLHLLFSPIEYIMCNGSSGLTDNSLSFTLVYVDDQEMKPWMMVKILPMCYNIVTTGKSM